VKNQKSNLNQFNKNNRFNHNLKKRKDLQNSQQVNLKLNFQHRIVLRKFKLLNQKFRLHKKLQDNNLRDKIFLNCKKNRHQLVNLLEEHNLDKMFKMLNHHKKKKRKMLILSLSSKEHHYTLLMQVVVDKKKEIKKTAEEEQREALEKKIEEKL